MINQPQSIAQPSTKKRWSILFFIVSMVLGVGFSFFSLQGDLANFEWLPFLTLSQQWLGQLDMIIVALILLGIIILTSGLRFHVLLKIKVKNLRFRTSLMYGILARYYVLVTPWALGSQPILIGIMYQRKVPIGLATSAVMIDLLVMRLSMALIVLYALLGFGHLVSPGIVLFAWIGFFFTCIQPVILVLASLHAWLEKGLLTIIAWIFPRKKEKYQSSLKSILLQYRQSFEAFRHQVMPMVKVTLYSLLSQFSLLALPYFLMASFSTSVFEISAIEFNLVHVTMMTALSNVILGIVPTLGSAGAAEFTFATVFSTFIKGNYLLWAILLWRVMLFYVWLIIGVCISLYLGWFQKNIKNQSTYNPSLPLKIFIFNDGFFPLIDGVVRAVDGYARYLHQQGMDVTVVVPFVGDTSQYPYRILAIPQFKIPGFFYPLPYGMRGKRIQSLYQYDGPMLYHTHTPFLLGHLALRLAKQHRIPIVSTFHTKYYDDYLAATKSKMLARISTFFTMRFFKKTNAIWTVSKGTVDTIRQYGLDHRPIKIIPNGINFKPNPINKMEAAIFLKDYQVSKEIPFILFVGQLIWQKNLKLILDTYLDLEKKGFLFQAVFVGDGRDEKKIKDYAKQLQLNSKLIFTGKIKNQLILATFYQSASLFFFPSQYDNDPLVIKEAAAYQLPSLVLANTSIAQLLNNEVNGFIQKGDSQSFAARIIAILSDSKKLKAVGEEAKKTLVVSWSDTLKDLQVYYQEVLSDYDSRDDFHIIEKI
jgi:1,2-diacylglycerol 3-alpha-glucosyltransferase